MQRIARKYENSCKYFYNNHVYYLDRRGSSGILRCSHKNTLFCTAKIYFQHHINLIGQNHTVVGEHNHDGDPLYLTNLQFTEEVLVLARTTFDDLKLIYDTIKRKPE